ncbi:MAG: hypothetical protein ACK48F_15090, partial [Chryseotalea sp.]
MKTWFTWIKENPAEFSLYSGSLLLLIWLAISFTAIQIVFTILLLAVFAFNIWLTKKSVALRLKRLKDLDEGNRKLLLDTNKAFD